MKNNTREGYLSARSCENNTRELADHGPAVLLALLPRAGEAFAARAHACSLQLHLATAAARTDMQLIRVAVRRAPWPWRSARECRRWPPPIRSNPIPPGG